MNTFGKGETGGYTRSGDFLILGPCPLDNSLAVQITDSFVLKDLSSNSNRCFCVVITGLILIISMFYLFSKYLFVDTTSVVNL